jgi:hypothetical protein
VDFLGVAVIIYLILGFWLCILLPAQLAATRGRSAVIWVILTIFLSPLLTIPLLLIFGRVKRDRRSS